jgi:hypothetical protein
MVTPLESGPVKVHHTPFARCALSLLVSGPVETHRTPFCPLSLFSTSKWPSRDAPHILCSLLSSKWSSKNTPHHLPIACALSLSLCVCILASGPVETHCTSFTRCSLASGPVKTHRTRYPLRMLCLCVLASGPAKTQHMYTRCLIAWHTTCVPPTADTAKPIVYHYGTCHLTESPRFRSYHTRRWLIKTKLPLHRCKAS